MVGDEMRTGTLRSVARTIAFSVSVLLVAASLGAPAAARSFDDSKIDPTLAQRAAAEPDRQFDVIIRASTKTVARGRSANAAERAGVTARRHGGRSRFALGIVGGAAATVTGREVLALSNDRDVAYVFADAVVTATFDPINDAAKVTSLGILLSYANYAWSMLNTCGRGIGVAVIDSGVYAHPDLAGRITAAADFTQDPPLIVNGPLGDPGGHGTHVAGLIAGDGSVSGGAFTGTAPCANIIDVRVLDASGRSTTSTVLRGLQWVLLNRQAYGIRIANISFGAEVTGSYKRDPLSVAAEALVFAGVNVIAAAGNGGPDSGTILSPAFDPFVITVGALDDLGTQKPSDDVVASFSARGPSKFDKLVKPDVVAPGRRLVSALAPGSAIANNNPDRLVTAAGATTPQYLRLSGTSMAAPIVSGLVALLLEKEPTLSPFQIKYRVKVGVRKLNKQATTNVGTGLATAYPLWLTDASLALADGRVADAFAEDVYSSLYGQPIPWRSLTYHGGVDSMGTEWTGITWENIAWDNIAWENIAWERFNWEGIAWENIAWETSGESVDEDEQNVTDTAYGTWKLVD
jgi:serine protease AprX